MILAVAEELVKVEEVNGGAKESASVTTACWGLNDKRKLLREVSSKVRR